MSYYKVYLSKAIWWTAYVPLDGPDYQKIDGPDVSTVKNAVLCTINQKRILDTLKPIRQSDIFYMIGKPQSKNGTV